MASWISFLEEKEVALPFSFESLGYLTDEDAWRLLVTKQPSLEEHFFNLVSQKFGFSICQLDQLVPDPDLAKTLFSEEAWMLHDMVPLYNGTTLGLAVSNPFSSFLDTIKQSYGVVTIFLVPCADIHAYYTGSLAEMQPITRLHQILESAITYQASDIHLQLAGDHVICFLRVLGQLRPFTRLSMEAYRCLLPALKLHAHLDISMTTLPQDGRLTHVYQDQSYEFRLATLPTVYGEDVVMRLFHTGKQLLSLDYLGLGHVAYQKWTQILNHASGLILVTGPTGSGKTTTLYASLRYLLTQKQRVIVTLEDPVECVIEGVRHSAINPVIGYGFSEGLRAVLRQDPDCIMIGEIRDAETARTALAAAYTGHLVLASLHTEDCETTLYRLKGFGLDEFLIGYCLKGILSQKLASSTSDRYLLNEILEIDSVCARQAGWNMQSLLNTDRHYTWHQDAQLKGYG